jgi:hypothetical protein
MVWERKGRQGNERGGGERKGRQGKGRGGGERKGREGRVGGGGRALAEPPQSQCRPIPARSASTDSVRSLKISVEIVTHYSILLGRDWVGGGGRGREHTVLHCPCWHRARDG